MTTIAFDWDPAKATSNASKHGVTFDQASTVFRDPLALSIFDPDSSIGEERWITLGAAGTGALTLVVHTWEEDGSGHVAVRIISARHPTRNEARHYREGT